MNNNKHLAVRILVAAAGLSLSGVGVGLTLTAALGVDPASVFESGLARLLGVSFGTAAALVNVVIIAAVFFIDKKYLNISTLLAIFLIGYVADAVKALLAPLPPAALWLRALMLLAGVTVTALGVAVYTTPDLGVGAIDLVSQIISDKKGWVYRGVRVASDLTFLAAGWLLGGSVGAGTVVAALLLGPLIQLLRPVVYGITDRIPGCAHHV